MAWLVAALAVVAAVFGAAWARAAQGRRKERAAMAERERLLRDALQGLVGPAALGTLAAAFAHAANNRLTVMLAGLDLLAEAAPGEDEFRAALGLAGEASQALAADMAALLAGSRADAGIRVTVDVVAAARRATALAAVLVDAPPPVTIDAPSAMVVQAEPRRLAFALLLLLELGRKCRAATIGIRGETVEVAARSAQMPGLRTGRYCHLEVRFDGGTLPAALARPLTGPGHVVERLHVTGGAELAAVEAFALAQRGRVETRSAGTAPAIIDVHLPLADAAG